METSSSIRGTFSKSRFYGHSHWMNFVQHATKALGVIQSLESDASSTVRDSFAQCKLLGRSIKAREAYITQALGSVQNQLPDRAVSDQLVRAYLRTFESIFGVLDVPSFLKDYEQYWTSNSLVSHTFGITLLLVLAIGRTFCSDSLGISHAIVIQWIYTAQTWLNFPFEKSRANIDGVRIHSLLLFARQTNSVSGGLVWLSAGALLRLAMHIGLHIDPEYHSCPSLSALEIELRRRLWATVLELTLQSSMDSGGIPQISADDYDTQAPHNVDDAQSQAMNGNNSSDDSTLLFEYSQSPLRCLLVDLQPIRLKVARAINSFRSELSFEDTLRLSACLTTALRRSSDQIQAYRRRKSPFIDFQNQLFDLLTQRFLLALHNSFAVKAKSDPTYYYSRKICLETSLSILSQSPQKRDKDFDFLCVRGTGLFRDVYAQAASYLCGELIDQIETDGPSSMSTGSIIVRQEIHKAIVSYSKLVAARVESHETNIKGHIIFSCLLAQVEAMDSGAAIEPAIEVALKKSLEFCCRVLWSRVGERPSTSDPGQTISNHGQMEAPLDLMTTEGQIDWFQWDELVSLLTKFGPRWMLTRRLPVK